MRYCYFLLVLALGASGCMNSHPTERSAPRVRSAPERPVFDLPALAGLSIDTMRLAIGVAPDTTVYRLEPPGPRAALGRTAEWENVFEKDGTRLRVHFNARTRRVLFLTLVGHEEDALLQRGNLDLTDTHYVVIPMPDTTNAQRVTGIRLVPRG